MSHSSLTPRPKVESFRGNRALPVSVFALLVVSVAAAGCGQSDDPPVTSYHRDVAPILEANCTSCHRAGGIGPFALGSYDDAAVHAEAIRDQTGARTMPPSPADVSGACQSFKDRRWLDDDQIALLGAWADEGAPEGDPVDHPLDHAEPPASLTAPALSTEMTETYTPRIELEDDYRCFILPNDVPEDAFVTAYEVVPGEPQVVHHAILFVTNDAQADDEVEALDQAEEGPGYTCFGGSGVGASILAGWAPGTGATHYPEGTGVRLPAGRRLILQVHYNLAAGALPDRTRVALDLSPAVDEEAVVTGIADLELRLAPGQRDARTTAVFPTEDLTGDVMLHAVYPHMHTLGRTMHVERVVHDLEAECLVDVPRWDFHWQQFYFYEEPLVVHPGDDIQITCSYDTRERTREVTWGEGTSDEMCVAGFYVTGLR